MRRRPADLAESLVAAARRLGADSAQASVSEGSEFAVDVRQGDIDRLAEAGSRNAALKVIVDGRTAAASSSDWRPDTLERLAADAVARARLSQPDPFAGLPDDSAPAPGVEGLGLEDPGIPGLSAAEKIGRARRIEALALSDPRIGRSYGASVSTSVSLVALADSRGFSGSYRRTGCSSGVYLQAGRGDNLIDEGWTDSSASWKGLDPPEAVAAKAVFRVTRLIGAKRVATQNVPVVFEAPAASGLLGFLAQCVSGTGVVMKQSFLAESLGQEIAGPIVTVTDDPLVPGGPATRPFDSEGVASRRTPVIERGRLASFLLDSYAARKLGLRSTGNASGPSNFRMAPGAAKPEDLVRPVRRGLFLTGTIGFGRVPTTGDISQGAFGLWIENGEFAHPVAEVTLSGNLGLVLRSVEAVADDLDPKRAVSAPSFRVAEMSVGGFHSA